MFIKETYAWPLSEEINKTHGMWGREEKFAQGLVEKPK
jgi:hypothetical protein